MVPYSDSPGSHPSIQGLFSGKCVFITGATGFVGKALLEKLVRSCSAISQILVLIRSNKKYSSSERLQKLFESNVFDRIKAERPDALNKIRGIDGDITQEDLKLTPEDLRRIISEVNYVFHCAASVRFENDTKDTLTINLIGVNNILNLCHKITKLEALVHVSTAYSFCDQEIIAEKIYNESMKVEKLQDTISWMNSTQLKEFCDSLSHSRPSLYQYSKAMAEILISENGSSLPVIIVRPSIITAAAKEPFPGWIDNYNGPSGFIALSSKGILKTLLVRTDVNADWIPVDFVVNTLIVAAHHVAVTRKHTEERIKSLVRFSEVPIVNCVCPASNSITWYNIAKICIPLLHKYPSLEMYSVPGGVITSCPYLHEILKYTFHYLPAAVMDLGMLLTRRERRFVNDYRRIHKVQDFLQLYTMHKFTFKSDNMAQLSKTISLQDKDVFHIDQNLDWQNYLEDYVHGIRKYFLREDDSTLPLARKKVFKLRCINFCMKWIPISILLLLMVKRRVNFIPALRQQSIMKPLSRTCSKLVPNLLGFKN